VFRNDEQLAAVCRTLCARVGLKSFWTDAGPSERAKELLRAQGGPLSHGEKVMVFLAWSFWNGNGGLTVAELVDTLDRENLSAVGQLLQAHVEGPDALDAWLASQQSGLDDQSRP
jgi:hypothetical protein